ncbi:MAG: M20 family metallo-hydrolase [Bacteroidetes bacterium]|nr:M20 family metallo-hydrolase [Fibrella sp.]
MVTTPTDLHTLQQAALGLLKQLIATPSFSREENHTANLIDGFLNERGITTQRKNNNIWAQNRHFDAVKPTILLNSHHDTVRPNPSWTLDPFAPLERDGKLYGLGSNDAGGCLVALIAAFCHFYDQPGLASNLVLAASAEEEISGRDGLELILADLPPISFAIVGEPTQMQLAIAEKGLLVLDCTAHGRSGHAARHEGDNAIYKAIRDIQWLTTYSFPKVSPTLGPIKLSVTIINAGTQHNVVPDTCTFTVDVRVTEQYSLEEIIATIRAHTESEVTPRSVRLKPSSIPETHPIVQAGLALGRHTYGSPTTSDQAVLDCPSLKCGPGDSARSHSADEFIYQQELDEGIAGYVAMLQSVL